MNAVQRNAASLFCVYPSEHREAKSNTERGLVAQRARWFVLTKTLARNLLENMCFENGVCNKRERGALKAITHFVGFYCNGIADVYSITVTIYIKYA